MTPTPTHRLEIGAPAAVTILLVGTGGTGSFTALHLARLATVARQRFGLRLVFVDPDVVEPANIGRQNFCNAEIGQPKALALARRYSLAFGLEIEPVPEKFGAGMIDHFAPRVGHGQTGLTLIIGAVDNAAARRDIAGALTREVWRAGPVWWLDAGNSEHAGQVILGNSPEPEPQLSPLGHCTALPLPSVAEPGLLAEPEPTPEAGLSCADLLLIEVQSLMINQAMADWLSVYVYRLLLAHDLDISRTWINQRDGAVRSQGITGGVVVEPEGARRGPVRITAQEIVTVPACPECGGPLVNQEDEEADRVVEVMACHVCGYRRIVDEVVRDTARRNIARHLLRQGADVDYFRMPQPEPPACPECGDYLVRGQDERDGAVVDIWFCVHCRYDVTEEELEAELEAELLRAEGALQ